MRSMRALLTTKNLRSICSSSTPSLSMDLRAAHPGSAIPYNFDALS